jgi:predicted xylose isomerase-like sugar epimerase
VLRLEHIGYRGDYSFEIFNDDYQRLPMSNVAECARRSALSLQEEVLHRAAPLPDWTRQSV